MKLRFFCRKVKTLKDGSVPIELSICINSQRKVISTGRKTLLALFNSRTEEIKGDEDTNKYLTALKARFFAIETSLLNNGVCVNIDTVMDVYRNGTQEITITILQVFDMHIEYLKQRVEQNLITDATLYKYQITRDYLVKFIKATYNTDDIFIRNITPSFVERFYTYLLLYMTNNTAIQKMKQLKCILRIAIDEGYIQKLPFKLKLKKDKKEVIPLTLQEVNVIKNTIINNPRLEKVRDLFIFESFTGLAYADLMSLCKSDFIIDEEGNEWIVKNRHKTKVVSTIPLLPIAKDILVKYRYNLPKISNCKYNSYLKEVAKECGINKVLHTHLARHTYATSLLNAGLDMVLVSKCLGHANSKITESTYAKVLPDTIMKKMNEVKKKLEEEGF